MSGDPPGRRSSGTTSGDNSPAIGFANTANFGGKLFISLFAGDVESADKAKRLSGWNWPPFLLVVCLGSYALISAPDGPLRQFVWVYLAFGAAVGLALARLIAPAGGRRARRWRVPMSATALICAVAGTVGMDHVADHGEIDVTGRTRITAGTVTNGSQLGLVVDSPADRSRLRLTLTIRDAERARQFCAPETRYSAQLRGNASTRVEGVKSGQTVEFPLGGLQDEIDVRISLRTDEGCQMSLFVANAVLHD
ncbi:hypothetical protein [Streptomyces peucetius]|uniref:DUF4352 domain-containing protein n=1 Tax=Streptomyces peucetius TaxID=1950 RepID=A0ABY6IJ22_STRPE|nr:hypothetical protein [Streptomyces peucetius]UYQ65822.1 hypothetical protein OGH68_33130 [Streptomyces peucetius]